MHICVIFCNFAGFFVRAHSARAKMLRKRVSEKIEHIGKREIAWSYIGTAFMIGAGVILLPFILNKMSQETVGIWNIFQTITILVALLDFGFRPSFARTISYIFSGVRSLKKEGVVTADAEASVDYGLLSGTLRAMRTFYRRITLGVFVLLVTLGSAYFYYILQKYTGNRQDALIAWILLIAINCYNLYTLYYDALLLGKGYVKRMQQITIVGQLLYLSVAIGLIYAGLGLSAIVSAQLISTLVRRVLAKRVFFDKEMKEHLASVDTTSDEKEILRTIMPNAVKVGLTQMGAFLINKSAIFLGSIFLTLEEIGSYGVTLQVLDILVHCGMVYCMAFQPKLAEYRATGDLPELRRKYIRSVLFLFVTMLFGGIIWVLWGNLVLELIGSQTQFVGATMLCAMIGIRWLEQNHATAAFFIMSDNKIPFFIPSLVTGGVTIVLLCIGLWGLNAGLWALILAPGIAQAAYQNWKWPSVVIKELFYPANEEKR